MSKERWAKADIALVQDDRLTLRQLRVLLALKLCTKNGQGHCWPKREALAEITGYSVRKIAQATADLVTLGWIEKIGDGGRSKPSHYLIKTMPETGMVSPEIVPETGTPTMPEMGMVSAENSARNGHPHGIDQEIKQTNEQINPPSPLNGFDRFWNTYPKKRSKGDAEKAWKAIRPSELLAETIVLAVQQAKTSDDWRKENGKYIPYPATYLRAKGWEDSHDIDIVPLETSDEENHRPYRSAYSENERANREWHAKQTRDRHAAESGGRVYEGDFQRIRR